MMNRMNAVSGPENCKPRVGCNLFIAPTVQSPRHLVSASPSTFTWPSLGLHLASRRDFVKFIEML
jgi:hypothetical protein